MSLSPRKRVLNFRLTEHEYIEVKQASEELGSRCVSDFVRSVVLATTRQRGGDSSVAAMFKDIDRRIAGIDSQLYRLMEVVHHGAVSSSPPEAVVEPGRERERSQ